MGAFFSLEEKKKRNEEKNSDALLERKKLVKLKVFEDRN